MTGQVRIRSAKSWCMEVKDDIEDIHISIGMAKMALYQDTYISR